jgi:hypothetical protein
MSTLRNDYHHHQRFRWPIRFEPSLRQVKTVPEVLTQGTSRAGRGDPDQAAQVRHNEIRGPVHRTCR